MNQIKCKGCEHILKDVTAENVADFMLEINRCKCDCHGGKCPANVQKYPPLCDKAHYPCQLPHYPQLPYQQPFNPNNPNHYPPTPWITNCYADHRNF